MQWIVPIGSSVEQAYCGKAEVLSSALLQCTDSFALVVRARFVSLVELISLGEAESMTCPY